jgi:hypothetical protein
MTRRSSATVLRQIEALFTAGSCRGLSDRQLLARFVANRDAVAELAFTALVERHGSMVLGVCRRILADSHDAEDAFQATFLVLVRQAGSIRVDAVNRRDEAVVGRIIADDFAGIDSGGGRFTKSSYLLDVRNGAFGAEPRVQEEVKVRLFGESPVVTSRIKLEVLPTWNGLMNVYVKRQGRW